MQYRKSEDFIYHKVRKCLPHDYNYTYKSCEKPQNMKYVTFIMKIAIIILFQKIWGIWDVS